MMVGFLCFEDMHLAQDNSKVDQSLTVTIAGVEVEQEDFYRSDCFQKPALSSVTFIRFVYLDQRDQYANYVDLRAA